MEHGGGIHLEIEFKQVEPESYYSNATKKSKKLVRYNSDFIRKHNFGFYNSELLNKTNIINKNYSRIFKKNFETNSSLLDILEYSNVLIVIKILILVNLFIFLSLLALRIGIIKPKPAFLQNESKLNRILNEKIINCKWFPFGRSSHKLPNSSSNSTIWFNIGGTYYNLTASLIANHPNSLLSKLVHTTNAKEIWIARDGEPFSHVYEYLKYGHVVLDNGSNFTSLIDEARFYNLTYLIELIEVSTQSNSSTKTIMSVGNKKNNSWFKNIFSKIINWKKK